MDDILGDFRRLLQFSGREPRSRFWPYCAIVVVVYLVAGQMIALPIAGQMVQTMLHTVADPSFTAATRSHDPIQAEGVMLQSMSEAMRWLPLIGFIEWAVVVALLAAAVSRQLHDAGLSGYWGLLPVPLTIVGQALRPLLLSHFDGLTPALIGGFMALGLLSLVNLAALIVLIVLLCRRTQGAQGADGIVVV